MSTTDVQTQLAHDEHAFRQKFPALIPTNLKGAYAMPGPPDNFDPNTATEAELIKHGVFWPRPRATDHPFLKRAWETLYSPKRKIEWIAPRLEPQVGKTHISRKPLRQVAEGNFVNTAWSGAGIRGGGPWNRVFGQWVIPSVSQPSEPQGLEGGWNSSSWVGLDGFDLDIVSNDVLQAGVEQSVDAQGNASFVAWFEWFAPEQSGSPGYIFQVNVPGVAVGPGQMVFCLVNYIALFPVGNFGNVIFLNMMTNQAFGVLLAPPPGATASGNTIEWIMEAPDGGEPISALPRFTPVVFLPALGNGANGVADPANGDTVNIEDDSGTLLTSVTVAPAITVIDFIG
jgi:hypothetical protein